MKIIKLRIKLLLILLRDMLAFNYFRFSGRQNIQINFDFSIQITQEIKPSQTFENKVFNLNLAANKINECTIMPGEIFSFWHIVGEPDKRFKKSRAITNGVLQEEWGGGLCQVSGIIYHLAILSGLKIIERHNHSIDIYTEETRFTRLGTDATVGYGNKDLRIQNIHKHPVKFRLEVKNNYLIANLLSIHRIESKELFFHEQQDHQHVSVEVFDQHHQLINKSRYRRHGL